MQSRRASQYDQMPGAFPSDDEEEYTEEDFLEMMNDVTRQYTRSPRCMAKRLTSNRGNRQ